MHNSLVAKKPVVAVNADNYRYLQLLDAIKELPLQRFGYVKVEATSFTVSEPVEPLMVAPLLYYPSFCFRFQ